VRTLETDYLVIGAGAAGMSFTDTLVARSGADVLLVDSRHAPGGHWLDAYPFVRLHQPSAYYGVSSRALGDDRVDAEGPNAGFYERATAAEITDYFGQVLEQELLPTGRVRFLGQAAWRGEDAEGQHVMSLLTGEETVVKVHRRVVDATYVQSEIPSRHTPDFAIDAGVRVIPPNALVGLDFPASGFTVIGGGKTAMDTCSWLLDMDVDPDRVRWVRSRDAWLFDRTWFQPLQLVESWLQMSAGWVESAARARNGKEFAQHLEERGIFIRIDPAAEADLFRGATISRREVEALRGITRVVRMGRVRAIGTHRITLDGGEIATTPTEVHVDCTAAGVPWRTQRPVFDPGRITMQYVTFGLAPWSAATVAAVEALELDDAAKNRLTPVVEFAGGIDDVLAPVQAALTGQIARTPVAELAAWNDSCRLNPARGGADKRDDPRVVDAYTRIFGGIGPAMRNLAAVTGAAAR
jgi:hypothetical protein